VKPAKGVALMSSQKQILVYNRKTGDVEPEIIMGEGFVRFLYENALGRLMADSVFKRRTVSRLFGFFQDRRFSAGKIEKVAADLKIDLSEAEKPTGGYATFNDFFSRSMKKEARPVSGSPSAAISPCDARLMAFPAIGPGMKVNVKGCVLDLETLLGGKERASLFNGGTLLVYRLCPADYHRFHFPEACTPTRAISIIGDLHSVNPIALASGFRILDANYRQMTLLEKTPRAGTIAMVEVGAMCVGSVVQTFEPGVSVARGDEKGMFRCGGSSVVVLYEQDRLKVDDDILDHSSESIETIVKFGSAVGVYNDVI